MIESITLRKVNTSEELILDMVSAPGFILQLLDWGVIESTHYTYKYVNQVGVSVIGTSLETREVAIEGWGVAQGEVDMTSRKRFLNQFINPQEAIELIYGEYKILFIPNTTIRYATNPAENNETLCKFQVVGTCPNPMFSDKEENMMVFASTTANFCFPLVVSESLPAGGVVFGLRTNSLIASIINRGAVSVGMRIVLRAKGALKKHKLININTQ